MMLRCDVAEVLNVIKDQPNKAVYVVKHDYTPSEKVKYLNTVQYAYPRKNWSSFVLWNCGHPSNKALSPDFFNVATGLELHRFTWLKDEEIGSISHEWNWLAGWYKEPEDGKPKAVHYTEGGPWFKDYRNCEYSDLWKQALHNMMNNN